MTPEQQQAVRYIKWFQAILQELDNIENCRLLEDSLMSQYLAGKGDCRNGLQGMIRNAQQKLGASLVESILTENHSVSPCTQCFKNDALEGDDLCAACQSPS